MNTLWQDLRYGLRRLVKNPGFTLMAALTLALGIGANTAIFSAVNAVLLRSLPLKEPQRLVQVTEMNLTKGWEAVRLAPANYLDLAAQQQSFTELAAYSTPDQGEQLNLTLTGAGEGERLQGGQVTGNLFSVLGVEAALGRTFSSAETWAGNHRVALLSHQLWQRRFGGDPAIIGREAVINGQSRTIVGVMPTGFYFPTAETELWLPFGWERSQVAQQRRPRLVRAVARLKSGVTVQQAQAEMNEIARRLEQQYPTHNTGAQIKLIPLHEWIVGKSKPTLLLAFGAVSFVLLIACLNVANLLLARMRARDKELAVRAALGASRLRLVRQVLTESLILFLIGGAIGLGLAFGGTRLLATSVPSELARLGEISVDGSVLSFTSALSLLTGLLFGLIPALQVSRPDLHTSLKGGSRGSFPAFGQHRLRSLLVVIEVALALVLLMGAGLMLNSRLRLNRIDPGLNPVDVLTLQIFLPNTKYPENEQKTAFYFQAIERVKTLPGVKSVGVVSALPLKDVGWTSPASVEGRAPNDYLADVRHKEISPDYFRALGTPLLKGRPFTEADLPDAPRVIIINETLARLAFRGADPVGQRIKFARPDEQGTWRTIVGVAQDQKQASLGQPVEPEIFWPLSEAPPNQATVIISTAAPPLSLMGALRSAVQSLDKDVPLYNARTMAEVMARSMAQERFILWLLALFASVALALAAVGIYGVISYSVTQRRQEIGVRLALGAQRRDILKLVVGQGALLAALGIGIGLIGALALTRLMSHLLFGISTTDPLTFAAVALLLASVALLASYLPARQATKVDPMVALRYE